MKPPTDSDAILVFPVLRDCEKLSFADIETRPRAASSACTKSRNAPSW